MQELRKFYHEKARQNVKEKLNLSTIMEVPVITKVVVNMGFGRAAQNKKQIALHLKELELMTGQIAVGTIAKKSIANFKIREGATIGGMVTLRGEKLFGFLSKMIHIVFPRTKEFNGLSKKSFDGQNNYTFGLQEQMVFPEIAYDKIEQVRGVNVTICMKGGKSRETAIALLEELGWPWEKKEQDNG